MTRLRAVLLALICVAELVWARQPVRSKNAIVVTEEPIAADVGVAVLKSGGNAIDAAIAVAFALAVTFPNAGNIGGGGFLLAQFADGKSTFIDFREKAPGGASRNMYLDPQGKPTRDSIDGWRASGVPGTVAGLEFAHRKYGSKPWADLVTPAIRLAREGIDVPYGMSQSLKAANTRFIRYAGSRELFGKPVEVGDRFVQTDLARTLDRLARDPKDFYIGETARLLAEGMKANGGLITLADLKAYQPKERVPLTGKYKGLEITTAPPPSSGGIGILQMLGVLEGSGYEKGGAGAASTVHFMAETMRRFYADRSEYLADPDFRDVPVRKLLHPMYIKNLRTSIDVNRATNSDTIRPGRLSAFESSETTHFSIIDRAGNAVSLTYTLNGSYGSGVVASGLGFLLNNEMDDFAAQPGAANVFGLVQGEANAIQPGKRPLSSMTPTIIRRDGKPFMVVGGPGGGRIITAVLQTMLNVIDFHMNVQDAVDAPRFHHQWKPDMITMESGFSPDTIRLLEQRGHKIEVSPAAARVFAIVIDGGWLQGAADGRGYGKAEGY